MRGALPRQDRRGKGRKRVIGASKRSEWSLQTTLLEPPNTLKRAISSTMSVRSSRAAEPD